MIFSPIPAGTFLMGGKVIATDSLDKFEFTELTRQVTITHAFYLGAFEVTQQQYAMVMDGANPSHFRANIHPVETVSYAEATTFCQRLSERPDEKAAGRTYRLPTEAEWEYACRCGTTTVFSFGDDERRLGDYAWYQDNASGTTHPVGQKQPNLWGLYDMHGNVWEWCHDWFAESRSPTVPSTDPQGPATPSVSNHRVLRGGSWNFSAADGRSAYRGHGAATNKLNFLGFRVVMLNGLSAKPVLP